MTRIDDRIDLPHRAGESTGVPGEFAKVYDTYLGPVWRFVRSRVPDHQEAQDVTSDAFARAWRAWPRFDPGKGSASAWLMGIARHTVADWWRRSSRHASPHDPLEHEWLAHEVAAGWVGTAASPEGALLEEDRLHEVGRALAVLNDHEREVLALRFGAELKIREIAEVLEVSPGSVKMTIHRAIGRLRPRVAAGSEPTMARSRAADEEEAIRLDALVDGILQRGHSQLSDDELTRLVLHIAAVHAPPVPDDLPGRIASCVTCETTLPGDVDGGAPSFMAATRRPASFRSFGGGLWIFLLGPACLICVAPLWLAPPLAALGAAGLHWVPEAGHYVALAFAPAIAWLVWRNRHRHGRLWPSRLAAAGAAALVVHAVLHLDAQGSIGFVLSDWLGWGLLTIAVAADLVFSVRRRREERRWLEAVTASV